MVHNRVAAALDSLLGRDLDSDCSIVFCLESSAQSTVDTSGDGSNPPPQQQQAPATFTVSSTSRHCNTILFGNPIPGHKFVLRHASDRFQAQLDRWLHNEEDGHNPAEAQDGDGNFINKPKKRIIELRVPLCSEDELPAAWAAIEFAYTGRLHTATVRETLEVRKQAAYLQIKDCTAACDEQLISIMSRCVKAVTTTAAAATGLTAAAEAMAATAMATNAANQVLVLYDCEDLWPDLEADPTFTAVLAATKPLLVWYFKDTLAVLNSHMLRQQLLALSPRGLMVLLESDDFGTDCEASVLLLLATWIQANFDNTDLELRQTLMHQVRLVQLSRPYLHFLVPQLAVEFQRNKRDSPAGWLSLSPLQALFLGSYAQATWAERMVLCEAAKNLYDLRSSAYSFRPRAQCLSPVAGRSFTWCITERELLTEMETQPSLGISATFNHKASGDRHGSGSGGGAGAATECMDQFTWGGFEWRLVLMHWGDSDTADLGLFCELPRVLGLEPSPVHFTLPDSAGYQVIVSVDHCEGGTRRLVRVRSMPKTCRISRGIAWVWSGALRLQQPTEIVQKLPLEQQSATAAIQATAGGAGRGGVRGGGGGGNGRHQLAAWVRHLCEGYVSGTVTLIGPPA